MKNFGKRLLVLVMVVCMVVTVLPQPSYAWGLSSVRTTSVHLAKQLKTPAAPKAVNVDGGIRLSWNKISGAAKYRVFYRIGNGRWTKITDTKQTSYTWKGAKSGTKYTFTVRCVSGNGRRYTSKYNARGTTITYIAAPKLGKVANTGKGVQITWTKSRGAAKYRVFYRIGNGKWQAIADVKTNYYTWTQAKPGTKYTFTVRCISNNSKSYISGFNAKGLTITTPAKKVALATPALQSVSENSAGHVTVTWTAVRGAAKYRVFRSVGNGWVAMGDTTATSFTDSEVDAGTRYTYTVRCLSSDGKSYTSAYDRNGLTVTTKTVTVTSEPVDPDPTPVDPDPTPVDPDPTPVDPDPTPVDPDPTPVDDGETGNQPVDPGTNGDTDDAAAKAEEARKAAENERKQEAENAITELNKVYLEASNFQTGMLSDEVFFKFNDVFYTEQEVRTKYFNYILRGTLDKIPTDAEIEQIKTATKNLSDILELAKSPDSLAKFDPSKLVYYKTESMKLHDMFNEFRKSEGRETTEWRDVPAEVARVQASYNVIASAVTSANDRASAWNSARHEASQIGTNGIDPENESSYANDAYNSFLNSPHHRSNVLAQGSEGEYEGIAIVGYTHHGFNHVVCICDGASVDLVNFDGFDYAWDSNYYVTIKDGAFNFESLPGVTKDAVKNCTVK